MDSGRAHQMQFTDDEIETIKEVLSDWGSDMPCADYNKVQAIGIKLGVWEEEKPPIEEEIKKQEEFRNSPLGLEISKRLNQSNEEFKKLNEQWNLDFELMRGIQWGTKLISSGFKFNF